jgi:magnesium chelatase accessory protein
MLDWLQAGPIWPHATSSRFVEAAGLRWHVQTTGTGPLVLLLHGTGLGSYSWAPLIDRLADRFSFVAPDFPGHTFTSMPAPEGLTLDAMADGLRALLATLDLSPRLVVGHSAGAALGAKLILEGLPARGFVGINPAILLRPDPRSLPFWPALEWTATRPIFVDLATRYCADRGRLAFAFNRAAPKLPPAMLDLHHRVLAQRDQHLAAFGMMARWDVRPVRRALSSFPVPALLFAGERDPWFPPQVVRALASEFPSAETIVIPGTGHLSHEEDPDLVASHLLGFAGRIGLRAP